MARNRTVDIPVSLYNYGGASLTGLTFETTPGNGITANVINNGDNLLTAGEQQGITLRITSSTTAPDTSYATMKAKVNEGLSKTLNANISIVQLIPVITTSPSFIDTGMVRGNQKIATFNISNAGEETLRNARIEGPSTSWMSLTVNRSIGDITPGTSKSIGIMFSPPATLAQGVYDDRIVIYSDNHIPYTYHIQVTVTSNAVGNVLFDVLNELMEDVPGATITLQHQTLTELIYTLRTGTDGTVMLYDIPEGRYTYNVSPPPGHTPYSGSFTIQAGMTTTVPIALEMTMVTVTWSVTPTVIQDKYEIVVTQTFETNVPAPVLITEPPSITLPELLPGQVFNGEFTVKNYGLIAVDNIRLEYPLSFGAYDIEILTSAIPKTIKAMQRITVPYRITKRMQTACIEPSLLDEVMGYGGSSCLTSFNIITKGEAVICPNTPQQRTVEKSTAYTVAVPYDCPSGTSSSTGGYYVPPPSGGAYYTGGGTPTQTGVGGSASTYTTALNTGNNCECKDNCEKVCGDPDKYCIGGQCTKVTLDYVDAKVEGKESIFTFKDRLLSFTGDTMGENCEFQYKWDLGNGITSTSQSTVYTYTQEGVYYPSFTAGCKKCGPSNSDQVMVVVGCPDTYADPTMCCVGSGRLTPNNPIAVLSECPNRVKNTNWDLLYQDTGGYDYDGCTSILDNPAAGFFTAFTNSARTGPCDYHDRCYQTCWSGDLDAARLACDKKLWDIAIETCMDAILIEPLQAENCIAFAGLYYAGLRLFAENPFLDRQKQVCNCCK